MSTEKSESPQRGAPVTPGAHIPAQAAPEETQTRRPGEAAERADGIPPGAREQGPRAKTAAFSRLWGLYLVSGILWVLYGMLVLSLRPSAVTSLALLAGIAFIFGGISQIFHATRVDHWPSLWFAAGILAIAAGILAILWPGPTLLVLAVFVAWYLVFSGVSNIIAALVGHRRRTWWALLLIGALEIVLGVWAISSPGRELLLLVNLVGFGMVLYGITEIFAAFGVRKLPEMLGANQETHAAKA
ncbi:HdeD family acid-resistance protein [Actinopolymorpha pittospori]